MCENSVLSSLAGVYKNYIASKKKTKHLENRYRVDKVYTAYLTYILGAVIREPNVTKICFRFLKYNIRFGMLSVCVCEYVCASVLSSGSVSILSLLEPLKNTTTVTTARGG